MPHGGFAEKKTRGCNGGRSGALNGTAHIERAAHRLAQSEDRKRSRREAGNGKPDEPHSPICVLRRPTADRGARESSNRRPQPNDGGGRSPVFRRIIIRQPRDGGGPRSLPRWIITPQQRRNGWTDGAGIADADADPAQQEKCEGARL